MVLVPLLAGVTIVMSQLGMNSAPSHSTKVAPGQISADVGRAFSARVPILSFAAISARIDAKDHRPKDAAKTGHPIHKKTRQAARKVEKPRRLSHSVAPVSATSAPVISAAVTPTASSDTPSVAASVPSSGPPSSTSSSGSQSPSSVLGGVVGSNCNPTCK